MKASEGASKLRAAVEAFFDGEILPRHREWVAHVACHPGAPPFLGPLRARARELGLPAVRIGVRVALPHLHRFYARLGYHVIAEHSHPGYAATTFVTMEKRLAALSEF